MTSEKAYRLGDYRITLYDDVLVRWEHHIPLGMARGGRCFLYGDVLILGEKGLDEDGFLIGEFLEGLRKLPPWTGTRYYCFAGELLDPVTGQNLTGETLARYSSFADRNKAVPGSSAIEGPGIYRLNHYWIIITADGRISWQSYEGLNSIVSGPCSVESGILVIGPREHDKLGEDRKEFLDALDHLPPWDKTEVWCRGSVLRLCEDMRQKENSRVTGWLRKKRQNVATYRKPEQPIPIPKPVRGNIPEPEKAGRYRETSQRLLLSGMNAVKGAWQRVRMGKGRAKWPLALIIAVLLLGSAAGIYIAEKGFPWSHGIKKHHQNHHDH